MAGPHPAAPAIAGFVSRLADVVAPEIQGRRRLSLCGVMEVAFELGQRGQPIPLGEGAAFGPAAQAARAAGATFGKGLVAAAALADAAPKALAAAEALPVGWFGRDEAVLAARRLDAMAIKAFARAEVAADQVIASYPVEAR